MWNCVGVYCITSRIFSRICGTYFPRENRLHDIYRTSTTWYSDLMGFFQNSGLFSFELSLFYLFTKLWLFLLCCFSKVQEVSGKCLHFLVKNEKTPVLNVNQRMVWQALPLRQAYRSCAWAPSEPLGTTSTQQNFTRSFPILSFFLLFHLRSLNLTSSKPVFELKCWSG